MNNTEFKNLKDKIKLLESEQNGDRTGQHCDDPECDGVYKETSIHDDMDGVLHCSVCNKKVNRYIEDDDK